MNSMIDRMQFCFSLVNLLYRSSHFERNQLQLLVRTSKTLGPARRVITVTGGEFKGEKVPIFLQDLHTC